MVVVLAAALCMLAPQGPDSRELVRRAEEQRTAVIARVASAVCSVMPLTSAGGGSGVIIDPAGFVLTNFHVIQKGRKGKRGDDDRDDPAHKVMKLGLPDGRLYLADVLGIDPGSDLAVLLLRPRADGAPFPFADLGDSDQLLVGQTVFAMGNPFLLATDFTPTVTWGVVSGTHRYQAGGGNRFLVYPDCIQVDAPVNPGNSGGPLFNEAGEVVGINGRISVRDRGRVNTGVGFAIASNQIRNFLGDMMAGRHAEHGTLDLNAWFMNAKGDRRRGVFVQSTFADSRAVEMGVGLGDELVRFNGQEVRSANQLATLVGVLPAGSWVSLAYRPLADDETFGDEREIVFRLTRLDTGSSRDEDRIASEEHRRLARLALTRDFARDPGTDAAGTAMFAGDARVTVRRQGSRLRWDEGGLTLVRNAPDDGFALGRDGAVRELSPEERAKLERVHTTNPLLWTGADRLQLIEDSVLEGGVLVFGVPAYRFRLPGDGQREVYLYAGGGAAGCRYRDPVYKKVVEYRFSADGSRVRSVFDDTLRAVGTLVPAAVTLDLFGRPR